MPHSATKQRGHVHPQRSEYRACLSPQKKELVALPLATKAYAKSEPRLGPIPSFTPSLTCTLPQHGIEGHWLERLASEEPACLSLGTPTMPWTGSRRLLLGVLQDALRSFFQYRSDRTRHGKRIFTETLMWLWSSEQDWLYSFENICDHLRLDPEYIRQGLQRLLHATRPTNANPRRPALISQRRPFRLISGPGTRIPRKTQEAVPQRSVG
jgi:hypothetical protein